MVARSLSGWGNYPKVLCQVLRAESVDGVDRALNGGGIARGLGRSYADQALSDSGTVVDLTAVDRVLGFDETTGTLQCEAGLSLAEIIRLFTPRGFFPAVTPGTKFVTVGGCIANDVHGKGHHVDGCFNTCVEHFDLLTASGDVVRCSREDNPELFWATFGGLGLTGVILRAALRLRRVETTYFRQQALVVRNLGELLEAFERFADQPYSVAWIDPLAKGAALGRGVLTVGDHARPEDLPSALAGEPLKVAPPGALTVPFDLPNFALNPLTLRALNAVIGQVQARGGHIAHYEKFFYPLDAVDRWNRGYGPRGFTQYQFVVPLAGGERAMRAILERIAGSGQMPFLNVLKKFGEQGPGHLSFPLSGYTFAIDFPVTRELHAFTAELDRMVIDAGGRVYLGKDATLRAESLPGMYPRLDEWRAIKAMVDPDTRFRSHLSDRVGLTG